MTGNDKYPGARGVALLNAMVIILMVAALSTQLLGRSAESQLELRRLDNTNQLALFLDAAAMLVPEILTDNIGTRRRFSAQTEWYRDTYEFPVLDGVIGGRLFDLQSRFNIGWLRDPQNSDAEAAFGRLWLNLALPEGALQPFIETLRTEDTPVGAGQQQVSHWIGLPHRTTGLTPSEYARLVEHVADLGPDSAINLNTGSLVAINALVPQIELDDLDALLSYRDGEVISERNEFKFRLAAYLEPEVIDTINFERFDVGSDWFEVRLFARRAGQDATSRLIVRRVGERFVTMAIYSM